MKPKPVSREGLVAILRDMADSVAVQDSFEGSIEYSIPTEDEDAAVVASDLMLPEREGAFMVRASYRIGNRDGQGGVRMVGVE